MGKYHRVYAGDTQRDVPKFCEMYLVLNSGNKAVQTEQSITVEDVQNGNVELDWRFEYLSGAPTALLVFQLTVRL